MSFSPIISPKRCRTPARVESGDGETSSQRSVRRHLTLDSSPGRSAERLKPEFIVLLPNGLSLEIEDIRESHLDITVQKLIELVRNRESEELRKNSAVLSKRRAIEWGSRTWLEDEMGNNISDGELFLPNTSYPRKLILQDGVEDSHHFLEELWNITPEPHMLSGLPQDYTVETALADELDNSLQAVWASLDLRLISVDLEPGKITIFDTGEGMDSSPERSIRRWGTLGASSNRLHKQEAVGGKPPFLKPHFGVYGLGGVAAALHLGGCVCVSSKTKYSNKVVSLILEKRRLVEKHETGSIWKAPGEFREMTDDEKKKSPNGSFTKVEITQLRKKHFCEKTGQYWEIDRLQRMLKDIYFPYIQVDIEDRFNKTDTPVHFEVNGLDLTEVEGGEVATTLVHSGPGKPFVIDVRVSRDKSKEREKDRGKPMMCEEANCRITCHYFPVKQGEESIAAILDKLNQQGGGLKEDFESFSRVSVRRLGRLLPDARWSRLPFMDFKKSRASFSKSSFKRAKAFIDADAGFVPTTSKMDLEPKHPFTLALKSLGSFADTSCVIDKTLKIEMLQNGNVLSESLLRNHYINWLKEMHESFDEDAVLDEPVMVVLNSEDEQKKLGISQKVFRVSRKMRLGALKWDAGRKPPLRLKFLKGSANHSKDLYVTIEYFLSEGIEEEPGGTRIICRKLGDYKCNGSELIIDKDNASFKIGNSLSFSVDVLSSKKYEEVDENIWKAKLQREKARELSKNPSYIDILRGEDARKLGVNESFPEDATVKAGCKLPNEVIAVVRPQGFVSKTGIGTSKHEQKQLVGELLEMKMEVGGKYEVAPVHVNINIVPADKVARWTLCNHSGDCLKEHPGKDIENVKVRIGEYLGEDLYIRCYDEFGNGMEHAGQLREDGFIKEFSIFSKHNKRLAVNTNFDPKKIRLANDGTGCQITKILFKDGELDDIAPTYKATLRVFFLDMQSAEMSVTVFPGNPHSVVIEDVMQSNGFFKKGIVISKLVLKALDVCGNAIERGQQIRLELTGLTLQDEQGLIRQVGEQGHVNLSGLLKLSGIYNSTAKLQVLSELDEVMLIHNFEIQKRTLRIISEVPVKTSISSLVDLVVEIVDENGNVDKEMDGGYHFLIADCIPNLTFPLKHGKCVVQGLRSPKKVGAWQIQLSHSYHSELQAIISVEVGSFSPTQKPTDDEWGMHQLPKDDNVFQIRRVKDHAKDLTKRYEEQGRKAKKLEGEIEKLLQAKKDLGTRKAILEEELQRLENEKENLVSDPNANIITESCQAVQIIHTFEDVIREVKCLGNPPGSHAAATLIEMPAKENYNNGIIGIVALLGSVEDDCLNKICAEFLGPERMGAIVCNNQQVVYSLEKQLSGIDTEKMQSSEKNVYTGRFRAISLDNCKEVDSVEVDSNNQQKLLILNPPRLPSGKTPQGFIGYAVNFIHLNVEQLNIKIGSHQHGLRETLFFNLFKYLQVYNSRQQMVDAMDAIVTGAVSLDGGIIWTDNCFELGSREEPKIRFANVPSEERSGKSLMSPTTDPVRRIAFLHDEIYSKELELGKCKDEFLSMEMKEEDRQLKLEQIKISLLKLYEDLNV